MLSFWLGAVAIAAIVAGFVVVYARLRAIGKASLLDFEVPDPDRVDPMTARAFRFYDLLRPVIRRDVFSFGCFCLALANLPGVIFMLWVLGSVIFMVGAVHITSDRVQRQLAPATSVANEG